MDKEDGYKCLDLITKKDLNKEELNQESLYYIWQFREKVDQFLITYSDNFRLNDLGIPYHPLEADLLDIMEGKKNTLTINGEQKPIEYYKNRQRINGKKENPEEFINRVYSDYLNADVLYNSYLYKIDMKLCDGLRAFNEMNGRKKLPNDVDRVDRLCIQVLKRGINVTSLQSALQKRKIKNLNKKDLNIITVDNKND